MPKPLTVPAEATCGKRSATDGEPEGQKGRRKHIKQQPQGTKDDVTMSSGQKGTAKGANKNTGAKPHNAVLKTLCALSPQVREVFMCWMIKKEAPECKRPKEQLRAYSEQATSKGKGHGLGPPGIAALTGLLQALSQREAAQWERPTRQGWQTSTKRETIWIRRRHSIWYLIASWPKFTTLLCAVSSSSSAWQSIENTFVGQSDKQERIVFSVKLQAERWNEHCLQRSNRVGKK